MAVGWWWPWFGVTDSRRLYWNTKDEVDSYLGDQILLVGGVWTNHDSAVSPEHCVTTLAMHYTLARWNVL